MRYSETSSQFLLNLETIFSNVNFYSYNKMESYNHQLSRLGASARGFLSSVTRGSSNEEEEFRHRTRARRSDAQAGALVLFLAVILSFLMLWAIIALIGNAGMMSQQATFLATLLLFLTPIFPFAPILTLLLVYRSRVPLHAMVSAAQVATQQAEQVVQGGGGCGC